MSLARPRRAGLRRLRRPRDHKLRGAQSDEDARFCAELRWRRWSRLAHRGRAARGAALLHRARTGCARPATPSPTRWRRSSIGSSPVAPTRNPARRGVVHPLLPVWREETEAYCRAHGSLAFRTDVSNADTKRGLIRNEILHHHLGRQATSSARSTPARLPGTRRTARRAGRLENGCLNKI